MFSLSNLGLMVYFVFVSLIGTMGNGIILLAYGNRWNSSKSTSVIFILVLACVDLWTCLIMVPTIAVMEYREFEGPTLLCRFYSFSKILVTISSLIISFIALDRFLNIAFPHHRLLNPRRVKVSEVCSGKNGSPENRPDDDFIARVCQQTSSGEDWFFLEECTAQISVEPNNGPANELMFSSWCFSQRTNGCLVFGSDF